LTEKSRGNKSKIEWDKNQNVALVTIAKISAINVGE
jgi:hypothetical protein